MVYPCHLRDSTLRFLHDLKATGRLFQPARIESSSQKGLAASSHISKPSVEQCCATLCGNGDPLQFFSDHYLHVYVHVIGLNSKPKTPPTPMAPVDVAIFVAAGSWMHREFGRGSLRFVEFQWLWWWNHVGGATTLFLSSRVTLLQDWTAGLRLKNCKINVPF